MSRPPQARTLNDSIIARWTRLLGFFTGLLVLVTAASTYVLFLQYSSIEADQRPMIGLEEIGHQADKSRIISFVNTGKMPAFHVRIKIDSNLDPNATFVAMSGPCNTGCDMSDIEMFPTFKISFRVPRIGVTVPASARILARIDYEDSNGKHHKTGICFVDAMPETNACGGIEGNYAE